jgi:hypothetical protein
MLRSLYIVLLRAHPAAFCERFGGEMLESFDHAQGPRAFAWLFLDAGASLARQWTIRPEFRRPVAAVERGAPLLFQTIPSYQPMASALLHGAILTAALFSLVAFAMQHSDRLPRFLIGAFRPSSSPAAVARASVREASADTAVRVGSVPEDKWDEAARAYFETVRVLYMLDADHDSRISPREMAGARGALGRLDANSDGWLSAEECGLFAEHAMRRYPVLSVLDADGDGEISADEIEGSGSALGRLDQNRDGSLTPDEVGAYRSIIETRGKTGRVE